MISRTPVITGVGVVSSAGIGAEHFWKGIQSHEDRFREISLFSPTGIPNRIASEIGPWVAGYETIDREILSESRICAFAVAAQHEAMAQANCNASDVDQVLVGTTVGDIATHEGEIRTRKANAIDIPIAIKVDQGLRRAISLSRDNLPVQMFLTACSAGNLAVIRACQLIESGEAEIVVAGGAEVLSQMAFVGFSRMRGMAAQKCRPFSEDRDGMLLGEGAAFVVIESAEHAAARGVNSLAEILGYGMSCDARHPTAPDAEGEGIVRAMQSALGGLAPTEVDYICAHGTGTPQNDAAETNGYINLFGSKCPPLSSIKGAIGHSLGAASAIELVACVLGIQHQRLIPQLGLEGQSAPNLNFVSGTETNSKIDLVLNNAFAFFGNNTSVALGRPQQRSVPRRISATSEQPKIYCATASIAFDGPLHHWNGERLPELDQDRLQVLIRRFRSKRAAVVVAAIERWLDDAGKAERPDPQRCGIVLGSETGAGADIERFLTESVEKGDAIVNPGLFPWTVHNAAVGAAAIAADCRGPNIVISSGAHSYRAAFEQSLALLKAGCADLVYCGVYESRGDADGTIASITALATRPEFLGKNYLGPAEPMNLDTSIAGAEGVINWANTFKSSALRTVERLS